MIHVNNKKHININRVLFEKSLHFPKQKMSGAESGAQLRFWQTSSTSSSLEGSSFAVWQHAVLVGILIMKIQPHAAMQLHVNCSQERNSSAQ